MTQNVANKIYCPVCKNCYTQLNDVCPVCGFGEAGKIFVNIEDGDHWMAETVLEHKISWLNSREREIERRERLLDEKEKELIKCTSLVSGNNAMSETERSLSQEGLRVALDRVNSNRVQCGDWIYYGDGSDHNYLYKIRTDGTDKKKLNNADSQGIIVTGDWIYYSDASNYYHLYKIRTDGTDREQVGDVTVNRVYPCIIVTGDWIYYSGYLGLNKIRTNGTDKRQLCGGILCRCINVTGGWVYYSTLDYYDSLAGLYKIRINGTSKETLSNSSGEYINVIGDWFYYKSEHRICRTRTSACVEQELSNDSIGGIYILDDWVYYRNRYDNYLIYKIRTDGTDRQKVE